MEDGSGIFGSSRRSYCGENETVVFPYMVHDSMRTTKRLTGYYA